MYLRHGIFLPMKLDRCAQKSLFESAGDLKMMDGDGSNPSVHGRRQNINLIVSPSVYSSVFLPPSNPFIVAPLAPYSLGNKMKPIHLCFPVGDIISVSSPPEI